MRRRLFQRSIRPLYVSLICIAIFQSIKKEIERRLDCIQRIAYEPQLIWDDDSRYILKPDASLPPYYYRFKAVDDIKILGTRKKSMKVLVKVVIFIVVIAEKEIAKQDGSVRTPRDSFRAFLLSTLAATLNGNGQRLIHQFCDMYDMARHDPSEFGNDEYEAYRRLLLKLLDAYVEPEFNVEIRAIDFFYLFTQS